MSEGHLYYMVGAPGVGKSALLSYARDHIGERAAVVFAHRYVAGRADTEEGLIALTESEFSLRRRFGTFVMEWSSTRGRYAIGNEINYWLAAGLSVVVAGSRAHLASALLDYPRMTAIWVTADADVVRRRRIAGKPRGAGARGCGARPSSGAAVSLQARGTIVHLNNNGPLEAAGEALVELLSARQIATPPASWVA